MSKKARTCVEVFSISRRARKIMSLHGMTGCKEGRVVMWRERWCRLYWKRLHVFHLRSFKRGRVYLVCSSASHVSFCKTPCLNLSITHSTSSSCALPVISNALRNSSRSFGSVSANTPPPLTSTPFIPTSLPTKFLPTLPGPIPIHLLTFSS